MIIRWHENFITGDVAFLLVTSAIQLFIACPALGLIYIGMSGRRDIRTLARQSISMLALLSVVWCLWIFSLAFAPGPGTVPQPDPNSNAPMFDGFQAMLAFVETLKDETHTHARGGVIGGNDYLNFMTHSPVAGSEQPVFASRRPFHHIPHTLFLMLHMTLFIATPIPLLLLLTERTRSVATLLFAALWGTAVYSPLAHWVWGDGWLESLGVVDSAGGLIQVGVGFSALACGLAFARRPPAPAADENTDHENPVQMGMVALGMAAYWAATALFNGALTMHADGRAVMAFMNTHLAACAGVLASLATSALVRGKPDPSAACMGALAGLMAVSTGCAFILPQTALMTGAVAAAICCIVGELLKVRQKGHEPFLVFVQQGLAAGVGCLLAGVFATTNVAGRRWDGRSIEGAIEGNLNQIGLQAIGLASAAAWGFVASLVLFAFVRLTFGVREANERLATVVSETTD